MSQYIILAENIVYKNNKVTCINILDKLTTVAMPAEFSFDMAIMCGPDWELGEHHLDVKVIASNGKEFEIGKHTVNIPAKDFAYNAVANNVKILMDYSVEYLTFIVHDNGNEILRRKYPVISVLVPQKQNVQKQEVVQEPIKKRAKKSKKEHDSEQCKLI